MSSESHTQETTPVLSPFPPLGDRSFFFELKDVEAELGPPGYHRNSIMHRLYPMISGERNTLYGAIKALVLKSPDHIALLAALKAAESSTEQTKFISTLLVDAIVKQFVALGITDGNLPLTGPQVLLLAGDVMDTAMAAQKRVAELEAENKESEDLLFTFGPITCRNGVPHVREVACLYCVLDEARAQTRAAEDRLTEMRELADSSAALVHDLTVGTAQLRMRVKDLERDERFLKDWAESIKNHGNAPYNAIHPIVDEFHPEKDHRDSDWDVLPGGVRKVILHYKERAERAEAGASVSRLDLEGQPELRVLPLAERLISQLRMEPDEQVRVAALKSVLVLPEFTEARKS